MQKGVTLRGLEIFSTLAETGSVAKTAAKTGLSLPAVSQQIKNLETSLGTSLLDHSRRPMTLTQAGKLYIATTRDVLNQLRQVQAELAVLDITHLTSLRIGMIEDFESEITPRLVTKLARNLARCHIKLATGPSHEIGRLLDERALDVVVSASRDEASEHLHEVPLLRDPYILVVPKGFRLGSTDPLADLEKLSFLRIDQSQLMGRQIESQLARLKISLPSRFEIDSNQSIMALAASGAGWTITTPLGYERARRFQSQTDAHPLPIPRFAREISLFCRSDWVETVPNDIARILRPLLQTHIIEPGLRRLPWLRDEFCLLAL
jgi:DNA-binding transcriptional LysR family regulator